eukprot:253577-Hanusia_phi.AAC.2
MDQERTKNKNEMVRWMIHREKGQRIMTCLGGQGGGGGGGGGGGSTEAVPSRILPRLPSEASSGRS